MTVTFRPWRDGDDAAATAAFGAPDTPQAGLDRPLLGPDTENPWRRCLVAEVDGELAGAGAVSEARLHPDRLWLYVEVAPDHRRRGIGTELVRRLQEHSAPSGVHTLRARFTADAEPAAHFAASLGMGAIQRSRQVVVRPGALEVPTFGATGPALEDLATGSVELTKAVMAFYDATHIVWDRSEMTLGRAQDLLLAPATGARGAIVLRDRPKDAGGALLAFAIAYDPPMVDPGASDEGLDGSKIPDSPEPTLTESAVAPAAERPTEILLGYPPDLSEAKTRAAVRQLLAMVAARYPVQLEVDDAMAPLSAVVDDLLAIGSAHLVTETQLVATS
ncbi:GNAT family N-acetyltransferase [Ruania halotolerans]|uniref:GNAT family N-acetyltransferase n=1 Tax=Ruania halotolerans TaxID=2897773 RepID=UPI001E385F38|nr:GNAT family N-acetyltransferase [Ruania halotolerans]UFU05039.1 GNAT family N-acetyltransferase [Ruania halotolerans]